MQTMKFLGITVQARITGEEYNLMQRIVENNDKYENQSHYIRCAINKLNREEQNGKKLVSEN